MGKKVKKKHSNSELFLINIFFFFPEPQHGKSVDILTLS